MTALRTDRQTYTQTDGIEHIITGGKCRKLSDIQLDKLTTAVFRTRSEYPNV